MGDSRSTGTPVDDWLDQQATDAMPGELDSKGEPRGAAALSVRLHGRAESLRARLGIDPTAMARLLASFAVGVPGGDDCSLLCVLKVRAWSLPMTWRSAPAQR